MKWKKFMPGSISRCSIPLDAAKDSYSYYVCPVCGFTAEKEAPETCPVCGAKGKMFKKVD